MDVMDSGKIEVEKDDESYNMEVKKERYERWKRD